MRKNNLIYGFGINDSSGPVNFKDDGGKLVRCPVYSAWKDCLRRTYGDIEGKNHLLYYSDATFDTRWKYFTEFKTWSSDKFVKGYQLDKDILLEGNNHYGPDTCCFVPQKINTAFRPNIKSSELGHGVRVKTLRCGDIRYEAFAKNFLTSKNVYLGLHENLEIAQSRVLLYRKIYLCDVLQYLSNIDFKDTRVFDAIEERLSRIKSSL